MMPSIQKFKVWTNVSLALVASVFLLLFVLYNFFPNVLITWNDWAKTTYKGEHYEIADNAIKNLQQGHEEVILKTLIEWEKIQKIDLLFRKKRVMFLAYSKYLNKLNRYEDLLYWSRKWFELDDRDITASAFYYHALIFSKTDTLTGEKGLKDQILKFPTNPYLQKFYTPFAVKNNHKGFLINAIFSKGVRVYWGLGSVFSAAASKIYQVTHLKGNVWGVKTDLDSTFDSLRIDFPFFVNYSISNVMVTINETVCIIEDKDIVTDQLAYTAASWIPQGETPPFLYFTIGHCLAKNYNKVSLGFQLALVE